MTYVATATKWERTGAELSNIFALAYLNPILFHHDGAVFNYLIIKNAENYDTIKWKLFLLYDTGFYLIKEFLQAFSNVKYPRNVA